MRHTNPDEFYSAVDAEREERKIRRDFWGTLRRAARQIPFTEDVVAAYYCALDQSTPARVRYTLLAALAYFVMPADTIPDIIAGIGFSDDAAVLLGTLSVVSNHIGDHHRALARKALMKDEAA